MADIAFSDIKLINKTPVIRKAAILGAGVMGAQIAAHFANAGIPSLLFDLVADGKDKSSTARTAIKALAKQKPEPLASAPVTGCDGTTCLNGCRRPA